MATKISLLEASVKQLEDRKTEEDFRNELMVAKVEVKAGAEAEAEAGGTTNSISEEEVSE